MSSPLPLAYEGTADFGWTLNCWLTAHRGLLSLFSIDNLGKASYRKLSIVVDPLTPDLARISFRGSVPASQR